MGCVLLDVARSNTISTTVHYLWFDQQIVRINLLDFRSIFFTKKATTYRSRRFLVPRVLTREVCDSGHVGAVSKETPSAQNVLRGCSERKISS